MRRTDRNIIKRRGGVKPAVTMGRLLREGRDRALDIDVMVGRKSKACFDQAAKPRSRVWRTTSSAIGAAARALATDVMRRCAADDDEMADASAEFCSIVRALQALAIASGTPPVGPSAATLPTAHRCAMLGGGEARGAGVSLPQVRRSRAVGRVARSERSASFETGGVVRQARSMWQTHLHGHCART